MKSGTKTKEEWREPFLNRKSEVCLTFEVITIHDLICFHPHLPLCLSFSDLLPSSCSSFLNKSYHLHVKHTIHISIRDRINGKRVLRILTVIFLENEIQTESNWIQLNQMKVKMKNRKKVFPERKGKVREMEWRCWWVDVPPQMWETQLGFNGTVNLKWRLYFRQKVKREREWKRSKREKGNKKENNNTDNHHPHH